MRKNQCCHGVLLVLLLLVVVCCCGGESESSPTDAAVTNTTTTTTTARVGSIQRIVGGTSVLQSSQRYPWFVFLGNCGGMLVAPTFVLTAAHCLQSSNEGGTVRVGSIAYIGLHCIRDNNEFFNNCGQPLELIRIAKVTMWPDYPLILGDYALLELQHPCTITSPIDMDLTGRSWSYPSSGKSLWAIGFGQLQEGGTVVPRELQHVSLDYVNWKTCAKVYSTTLNKYSMCAYRDDKDACGGDSGGPLYDSQSQTVVGITSYGIGCAQPNIPGVYARISTVSDWITDTICSSTTYSDGIPSPQPNFCPPPPPTKSPSINTSSCARVQVVIKTDNYPKETSWTIVNENNKQVVMKSPAYTTTFQLYSSSNSNCIDSSACYTVQITDVDGICCQYGRGFVQLRYNDALVATTDTSFGDGCRNKDVQTCDSVGTPQFLQKVYCKGRANAQQYKFSRHWQLKPGPASQYFCTTNGKCQKRNCCTWGPKRSCANTGNAGLQPGGFTQTMCGKHRTLKSKTGLSTIPCTGGSAGGNLCLKQNCCRRKTKKQQNQLV